jgi:transcription antitermination factor NusG
MSFWAVAQTLTDRERTTATLLERSGYDVLAPRARFAIGDGAFRIGALFPGYLFVKVIDRWYSIQWTVGVLRLIMAGDQPAKCPNWEIEKIRRATGSNGLVRLPKEPRLSPKTKIVEGSSVRILTGTFQGLSAIYQSTSARQRQLVLLDLLGQRNLPIELSPEDRIEAN